MPALSHSSARIALKSMMSRSVRIVSTAFFLGLCGVAALATASSANTYDVVISGGRVMDPETGFDAVANVGISGNKIAIISQDDLHGAREIDATGQVVTAGFIDQHFHWTRPLGYKLALRDGVTTAMDCEAGTLGSLVDRYYALHNGSSQLNYGTAVSHELGRVSVLDGADFMDATEGLALGSRRGERWASAIPDPQEMQALMRSVDEGLRAGGIGVASTLGYMPGASAAELFELQKLAQRYGRATFVHTRHTPGTETTEVNGAQEILANAASIGAPASISHINNPGWEVVQALLVGMREQGHNVWGEYYPYAAGSTTINAQFLRPEIWKNKLGKRYEDTLQDPSTGKFLSEAEYLEVLSADPMRVIILHKMPEAEIINWVRLPGIVMASDAMPVPTADFHAQAWDTPYDEIPNIHPRGAGSRGKSLRLAREAGIPLMDVLATFSYNPAKYLGNTGLQAMQVRGRMQEGMIADVVVLDPRTVTDRSTYERGSVPTTGIHYVLVSGEVVVDQERVLPDVFPGQPIRFTEMN